MLSEMCMWLYRKQYPNDVCGYLEPSDDICIINKKGDKRVSPYDETDEVFVDRLERSKQAGRNLFYEEWTTIPEYKPGAKY